MERYLILTRDLCIHRPSREIRSKVYDPVSSISEYLTGTILRQEFGSTSRRGGITCVVLDTDERIKCNEDDVEEISEAIMELLIAIPTCKERYEVFHNTERLADGLEMQEGCSVVVRLPSMSGELSGKLRYKGKLDNKIGTYFGVELNNARGNTNGSTNKRRYFYCSEDGGVFVALHRVTSKKYNNLRVPLPAPRRTSSQRMPSSKPSIGLTTSNAPSIAEPVIGVSAEELAHLGIFIGMEVYIFTEVNGRESQESGTVKFIGRLPNELPSADIYVGIDLVNPVGNGRGVFNKRQLFKTKANHAALVPLSGVLPASTCDTTSPFVANSSQVNSREQSENGLLVEPHTFDNRTRQQTYPRRYEESRLFERGPPDGGPIAELDDEFSSQVDIYGSLNAKLLSDQDKIGISRQQPMYPPSITSKSQNLKHVQKPFRNGYDRFQGEDFEVGSMVEVVDGEERVGEDGFVRPTYGVIKCIFPSSNDMEWIAGIELEVSIRGYTDGTYRNIRYFNCMPGRALFVNLKYCRKDPRFLNADIAQTTETDKTVTHKFGDFEASRLPGRVAPPLALDAKMIGKGKGIQGHHNSCYLDSTLFSMFAYSYCLDSILFREGNSNDLPQYHKVQQVLKEDIVNPLRKRNFVRADRIMKLRELLDELGSVTGLKDEEKDPEEFLQTLLNHVFKSEPLFELRQGDSNHVQECYFYQIFMDKDEKMVIPSTQFLIEQSFLASDLKFREVPVCLILQMPRFGKDYKMYNKVRPSLKLDVTDMVEKMPRSCIVCGGLAESECKQCSIERSMQDHISSYCDQCAKICHQHPMRRQHEYKKIEIYDEYRTFIAEEGERPIERQVLDLYAVVCIATSHYVSFAKCGYGPNAKWCFFDSMADRVGEQSGYNIPEVTYCENFEKWLEMDSSKLLEMDQKDMPDHMRRLLCDAYMCLYQSPEMSCYA